MQLDSRPILLVNGLLIATLGTTMMVPAIVDLADGHEDWAVFTAASLITTLIGLALWLISRDKHPQMGLREAFIMTIGAWVFLPAFGCLPFLWAADLNLGFADAYFEAMSGLTTTGATVISGLDNAPPGILLWRGMLNWLGGLGIIVMAVAVMPMLGIGGMQLFKVEAFETTDKILPRATQISGSITLIYALFTLACGTAYLLAGMPVLDAVIHGMTTVATGGFSSKDASIGHFNSPLIDTIAIIFMILGSLPFLLYIKALQRRQARTLLQDSQVIAFLKVLGVLVLIAVIYQVVQNVDKGTSALRYALFNVTSIMTGTGYATTDYGAWGPMAAPLFFMITFIGGCAGSTSCGIKIFRFQVLYQSLKQHLNRMVYPNGIFVARYGNNRLPDSITAAVMSFFFFFFVCFALLAGALSLTGLDAVTALSGAATAISNVGPGLGEIIGPAGNFAPLTDTQKWILAVGMLVGRLELFTILVLFLPRFWLD